MSQGPLCPNLTKKVQKEVSQMANRKLSCAMLYRWFKCKLKPPNNCQMDVLKWKILKFPNLHTQVIYTFLINLFHYSHFFN